jgi:hypothetical protein
VAGYESDGSDSDRDDGPGLGATDSDPLTTRNLNSVRGRAWLLRLDRASESLQASAHRTLHKRLEIDAMCCTSELHWQDREGGPGGRWAPALLAGPSQPEAEALSHSPAARITVTVTVDWVIPCSYADHVTGPQQQRMSSVGDPAH